MQKMIKTTVRKSIQTRSVCFSNSNQGAVGRLENLHNGATKRKLWVDVEQARNDQKRGKTFTGVGGMGGGVGGNEACLKVFSNQPGTSKQQV